jgi:dTDP-4-amino-4,6-dideoxygalactose transaminase
VNNLIKPKIAIWGKKEWLCIAKSIISGRVNKGNNIELLSQTLTEYYPNSTAFVLNSARSGLIAALELFKKNQPNKTQVIIPEFICDSVPQTVEKCGLVPVFVPILDDLNLDISSLYTECTEKTLAVILPHMYGKPAKIGQAELFLKEKNIYLIDDAAQVAGVTTDNQILGTFGDVGLLSFAQAKTIVTGVRASGGILFVNNIDLIEALSKSLQPLPCSSGRLSALCHFLMVYKWQGLWKRLDYYIQRLKRKVGRGYSDYYAQVCNISNMEAGIALAQFASLSGRISATKKNIECYQLKQSSLTSFTFPQITHDNIYLTRMIIQSKRIAPNILAKLLLEQGVVSKKVYGTGSKLFDGTILSGLLEVPLQGITLADIDEVISALKKIENDSCV